MMAEEEEYHGREFAIGREVVEGAGFLSSAPALPPAFRSGAAARAGVGQATGEEEGYSDEQRRGGGGSRVHQHGGGCASLEEWRAKAFKCLGGVCRDQ
jgi:hypothetical protein